MEIKIKTDKEEKNMNLRPLYAREVDKGFNLFVDIEKQEEGKAKVTALEKYFSFLNDLISDISGMKKEEIENLFSEERDKLILYCQEKIEHKVDFLKSSSTSENSEKKTE